MAYSYPAFKLYIKDYICNNFDNNIKILDVGAGCGTYYDLLHNNFKNMDCVEIFKPNIEKYDLLNKYNSVFNENIKDFKFDYYDLIIIGDVLEHLTIKDAKKVLKYCIKHSGNILIAVPYCLEQGLIEDNEYEIHLQPDLTSENMKERYPELELLVGDNTYGYYLKKGTINKEMLLSIIIPCHNLEKFIEPCLNSLIAQKNVNEYKREIIFICDNCTDRTQEIIEDKMSKSSWQYKVIKASEGSPGGARNVGLNMATGKYIWFIDGDDWLTCDDAIDIILECIIKDDMDIIEFKIKAPAYPPEGIFGDGTVWRAMFSKRIIGDSRFNDRQNGEDNDFVNEIWNKPNAKIGKIALAPYFYNYPREGSQSDLAYNTYHKERNE